SAQRGGSDHPFQKRGWEDLICCETVAATRLSGCGRFWYRFAVRCSRERLVRNRDRLAADPQPCYIVRLASAHCDHRHVDRHQAGRDPPEHAGQQAGCGLIINRALRLAAKVRSSDWHAGREQSDPYRNNSLVAVRAILIVY